MDEPSIRTFYRTIGRDSRGIYVYIKIYLFNNYCRLRNLTCVDYFNENVKKNPKKVCMLFEDEEWTYQQVDELSNRVAHCFLQEGFRKGDEVALLMDNCPDYVCIWLGLAKIGVVTALININLKDESLAHSMNVIKMKALVFGQNFAEVLVTTIPFIERRSTAHFYCYLRKSEKKLTLPFPSEYLNAFLDEVPARLPLPKDIKIKFSEKILYCYTSGTTGLPKAAVITHGRFMLIATVSRAFVGLNDSQTIYNTLPLYHSFGGIMCIGFILVYGGKMVIRKKFSASNFWKDVLKYKVGICVYIGEICRYLLNQPKVPEETQHSIEFMSGLGLRPVIWKEFQDRFRIKNIFEIYGSTEGTFVSNYVGKTGAVGFISRIFFKIQAAYLIKVHPETGEILRDSNGLCVRCKPGEPGEFVSKISNSNPLKNFDGYINTSDSKKKIIKDCFKKGDMAFLSGDIFVMDEDGYLYFKDRFGDTFRWKGENVSTTEVESVISKILNLTSCVVYGVKLPDGDGRIGMAAIELDDMNNFDFKKVYEDIASKLPSYAIPAFIRICSHIETTGTHKLKKLHFKEQGFNPEVIDDPLYVLNVKKKEYIPLTKDIYDNIIAGKIKF